MLEKLFGIRIRGRRHYSFISNSETGLGYATDSTAFLSGKHQLYKKSTPALYGKIVLQNTELSTLPGAIAKVFTESGSHCLL